MVTFFVVWLPAQAASCCVHPAWWWYVMSGLLDLLLLIGFLTGGVLVDHH